MLLRNKIYPAEPPASRNRKPAILTRANVANFLQGLFVLPLCALFGGLTALLFHARGGAVWACVAFCALFPLAGAVKTRQRALLAGLLVGILLSMIVYLGVRPHP